MSNTTLDSAEYDWQKPVDVSTKPHIRPDGKFVSITIKHGDVEIQLTPEQAGSLAVILSQYR